MIEEKKAGKPDREKCLLVFPNMPGKPQCQLEKGHEGLHDWNPPKIPQSADDLLKELIKQLPYIFRGEMVGECVSRAAVLSLIEDDRARQREEKKRLVDELRNYAPKGMRVYIETSADIDRFWLIGNQTVVLTSRLNDVIAALSGEEENHEEAKSR